MLVDLQEAEQAQRVAAKVAQALAAPVNVGVARLPLVARVGVVWSPAHGNQLLPLLQAAEAALGSLPAGQGGVATVPVRA
jgi:predicted signal transduction protein with EAL and GGDEF domain